MRRWLIPLGVIWCVMAAALLVNERAATAEPAKPIQWEYKAIHYSDLVALGGSKDGATAPIRFAELGLNKLGEEAWELVAFNSTDRSYYLKRPKAR